MTQKESQDESTEHIELELPALDLISGKNNNELCKVVFNMFNTVPQGMTSFQIQNFVLSDREFPTADGKWWQAKLELWVRLQNVINMHYDYRKKVAKIKELSARIEENTDIALESDKPYIANKHKAISERLQVTIEENEFALVMIKKNIYDKMKEMQAFWDVMQRLENDMKFSKVDKEEQETAFWTAKSKYDSELLHRFPEVFK